MGGEQSTFFATITDNDQILLDNGSESHFRDFKLKKSPDKPNLSIQFKVCSSTINSSSLGKVPNDLLLNILSLEIEQKNKACGVTLLSQILHTQVSIIYEIKQKFTQAKILKIRVLNSISTQNRPRSSEFKRSNSYSTDLNSLTPCNANFSDSLNNELIPFNSAIRPQQMVYYLQNLESLTIETVGTFLDDGIIKKIFNNYQTQLDRLSFISYYNENSNQFLKMMLDCRNLNEIYIEMRPISKFLLKTIAIIINNNSSLEKINLKFNSTSLNDEDAVQLFVALNAPISLKIVQLDFHNNNFLSKGFMSLNNWIKKLVGLQCLTLCLTNNTIIPYTLKELGLALKESRFLQNIAIITGEDIEIGVMQLANELREINLKCNIKVRLDVSRRLQKKVNDILNRI